MPTQPSLHTAIYSKGVTPLRSSIIFSLCLCISLVSAQQEEGESQEEEAKEIIIEREINLEEYLEFQQGIIKTMVESGGTPSHHHGIGRLAAPVLETYLGKEKMAVLKALKQHFDPDHILNPGGILGIS